MNRKYLNKDEDKIKDDDEDEGKDKDLIYHVRLTLFFSL